MAWILLTRGFNLLRFVFVDQSLRQLLIVVLDVNGPRFLVIVGTL